MPFCSGSEIFEEDDTSGLRGLRDLTVEAPQLIKGDLAYWLDEPHDIYIPRLLEGPGSDDSSDDYGRLTVISSPAVPLSRGALKELEVLRGYSTWGSDTTIISSQHASASHENSSEGFQQLHEISDSGISSTVNSGSASNGVNEPVVSHAGSSGNGANSSNNSNQKSEAMPMEGDLLEHLTPGKEQPRAISEEERSKQFFRLVSLWPEESEKLDWGKLDPKLADRFKEKPHLHECTDDCYIPGIITKPQAKKRMALCFGQISTTKPKQTSKKPPVDNLGSIPTRMKIVPVRNNSCEKLTPFYGWMWDHQERVMWDRIAKWKQQEYSRQRDTSTHRYLRWKNAMMTYPIPIRRSMQVITLDEIGNFDIRRFTMTSKAAASRSYSLKEDEQSSFSYFADPPYRPRIKETSYISKPLPPGYLPPPNLISDIPFSHNTRNSWSYSFQRRPHPSKADPWNNFPTPEVFVLNQKPNIIPEDAPKELAPKPIRSCKSDRFVSALENMRWLESQLPWYKTPETNRPLEEVFPSPSKEWCGKIRMASLKELRMLYASTFSCEQREITVGGRVKSEYWRMAGRHWRRDPYCFTDLVDGRDVSLIDQNRTFVEDNLLGVKRRYVLKQLCQTMGWRACEQFKDNEKRWSEKREGQREGISTPLYFPSLTMLNGLF